MRRFSVARWRRKRRGRWDSGPRRSRAHRGPSSRRSEHSERVSGPTLLTEKSIRRLLHSTRCSVAYAVHEPPIPATARRRVDPDTRYRSCGMTMSDYRSCGMTMSDYRSCGMTFTFAPPVRDDHSPPVLRGADTLGIPTNGPFPPSPSARPPVCSVIP